MAQLSVMLASVYLYKGDLNSARMYFQSGSATFAAIGDQPNYGKSLGKLSNVYTLQGDLVVSERLCREALAIAQASHDDEAVALAYLDLSNGYLKSQKWLEGLQVAVEAYDIFMRINKKKSATLALINIVSFQAQLGNWVEAEAISAGLVSDLEVSGDIQSMSLLQNNLGVAAFNQGNFARAEHVWQDALGLNSQVQNPSETANLYNNLGMVYTKLGEWDAAEAMLMAAA